MGEKLILRLLVHPSSIHVRLLSIILLSHLTLHGILIHIVNSVFVDLRLASELLGLLRLGGGLLGLIHLGQLLDSNLGLSCLGLLGLSIS